jgi:hypothetical protein
MTSREVAGVAGNEATAETGGVAPTEGKAVIAGRVIGVRTGGVYGSSRAEASSRTTVLLARRNSRITLPAVRIASGSFSGGMTMTATSTSKRISKIIKPSGELWREPILSTRPDCL